MARSRTISPKFFSNDSMADLPFATRLLFIGLWTIADRSGRLEDRPRKIHAKLFPYDHSLNVNEMLAELDSKDFIFRYRIDGDDLIQIPKWFTYQRPHPKEPDSELPPIPVDLSDFKGCRDFSVTSRVISGTSRAFPSVPSVPSVSSHISAAVENPAAAPVEPPTRREKRKTQLPDECGRWFETEFWPLYWRRVDKADAMREWRRHATTAEAKDRIVTAVRCQKAYYESREPEHRPHASTWLHKQRYLDDPALLIPTSTPNCNGSRPVTFGQLKQQQQQEIFEDLLNREMERNAVHQS